MVNYLPYINLIKYCPTQNNWILALNYQNVINHTGNKIQEVDQSGKLVEIKELTQPSSLSHIFFNYMTNQTLVGLVLTQSGQLVLINNQMEIEEQPFVKDEQINEDENENGEKLIKLETKAPLPKIKGISSTLTVISQPKHLINRELLSVNMQKTIGLKEWFGNLSSVSGANANANANAKLNYSSFFGHYKLKTLLPLVHQWVKQSGNELDFQFQYYLNEKQLSHLPVNQQVTKIKFNQNCQITSFAWLKNFPKLVYLEFDQCQQINEELFREICKSASQIESITVKFCCGVNIRIFLELLKLDKLNKVVIDFPNFYCQVSPKDVLVTKQEWQGVHSLYINSENMTMDVLDYIIKACPELKDIYLGDSILKMVSKNIVFNQDESGDNSILNFHSSSDFRKGFRASRPMTFKNLFKNYISRPFSTSMLEKIRQQDSTNQEMKQTISEFEKID